MHAQQYAQPGATSYYQKKLTPPSPPQTYKHLLLHMYNYVLPLLSLLTVVSYNQHQLSQDYGHVCMCVNSPLTANCPNECSPSGLTRMPQNHHSTKNITVTNVCMCSNSLPEMCKHLITQWCAQLINQLSHHKIATATDPPLILSLKCASTSLPSGVLT